jgi:hypothetical protein
MSDSKVPEGALAMLSGAKNAPLDAAGRPKAYRRPSMQLKYEVPDRTMAFARFKEELQASPHYSNLKERDLDAILSWSDWFAYKVRQLAFI